MMMRKLLLASSIVALSAAGALAQSGSGAPSSPAVNPGPTAPDSGAIPNNTRSGAAPSMNDTGSMNDSSGAGMNSDRSNRSSSAMPSSSSASAARSATASANGQTVMQAQQALKNKGLYDGQIDGKLGPQTKTAISKFQ